MKKYTNKSRFLFFLGILMTSFINAQSETPNLPVFELHDYLQDESIAANSSSFSTNSLCNEIVPTVYLKQNQFLLIDNEENPVRLIADFESISALNMQNTLLDNVIIIVIQVNKIEDLNHQLKLSLFNHFPNLDYIYFSCSFELCSQPSGINSCEEEKIKQMIDNDILSDKIILFTTEISE